MLVASTAVAAAVSEEASAVCGVESSHSGEGGRGREGSGELGGGEVEGGKDSSAGMRAEEDETVST